MPHVITKGGQVSNNIISKPRALRFIATKSLLKPENFSFRHKHKAQYAIQKTKERYSDGLPSKSIALKSRFKK